MENTQLLPRRLHPPSNFFAQVVNIVKKNLLVRHVLYKMFNLKEKVNEFNKTFQITFSLIQKQKSRACNCTGRVPQTAWETALFPRECIPGFSFYLH